MVEFDPVVPKLTRFDPVVPKLKLNLILSFQIQKNWSCRSQIEIKSDPVVPKLKIFDPVVPNSKKLILPFPNWEMPTKTAELLGNFPTQSSTPWRRPGESPAPIRAPPQRAGVMRHLLRLIWLSWLPPSRSLMATVHGLCATRKLRWAVNRHFHLVSTKPKLGRNSAHRGLEGAGRPERGQERRSGGFRQPVHGSNKDSVFARACSCDGG